MCESGTTDVLTVAFRASGKSFSQKLVTARLMYLIRACGTAHLERRRKWISGCALDLRDRLRYTRPGHRKLNTNLLWWTGRCTRASRCSRWFTEFGPGERAIIDVGPESSRWFDDSVRLLVPTSVSLSEPNVSYSSDSDLNDFDLRRARPRTFVYWSTSHCNRFAVWNSLREKYEKYLTCDFRKCHL